MKACCEYTAESPGRRNARATSSSTSFDPLPSTRCAGVTPSLGAERLPSARSRCRRVVVQHVERAADRRDRLGRGAERVLVGGHLEDVGLRHSQLARRLGDRLARNVGRDLCARSRARGLGWISVRLGPRLTAPPSDRQPSTLR